MKNRQAIIEKYRGKLLGRRSWRCPTKVDFYVEDFLNKDLLFGFIDEIKSHEADLEEDGVNFLREYYGIDELAQEIYEQDPEYPNDSPLKNALLIERSPLRFKYLYVIPPPQSGKYKRVYEKYSGKILGFGLDGKKEVTVPDIMPIKPGGDHKDVIRYLARISGAFVKAILAEEASITPEGYEFLDEFIGVENLLTSYLGSDMVNPFRSEEEFYERRAKLAKKFKKLSER